MPYSAGSFQLPAVRYPYYDLAAGEAAAATLAPRPLLVSAGIEPRAPRALPPLERGGGPVWTDELAHDLVPWGWLVLLVGPPLLAWLWRRRGPAPLTRPAHLAPPAPGPIRRAGRPVSAPPPGPVPPPPAPRRGRLRRPPRPA